MDGAGAAGKGSSRLAAAAEPLWGVGAVGHQRSRLAGGAGRADLPDLDDRRRDQPAVCTIRAAGNDPSRIRDSTDTVTVRKESVIGASRIRFKCCDRPAHGNGDHWHGSRVSEQWIRRQSPWQPGAGDHHRTYLVTRTSRPADHHLRRYGRWPAIGRRPY